MHIHTHTHIYKERLTMSAVKNATILNFLELSIMLPSRHFSFLLGGMGWCVCV